MLHITKLHLTMLNQRSKAGRKREPAAASCPFAGGHENCDPSVQPFIGSYISDDARSCVNDDCFDLPAFANRKFQSEKSPILEFLYLPLLKRLHYMKTDNMNK